MNILLLNGHGGKPWDCGARGCGYEEADLVRECTDRVEAELKKYANVYRYPKDRNAFQDIENGDFRKVLLANFKGIKFDYAFERHFNAFNGKAHGTECYVTSVEEGITVEQAIMKRMGKYFTLRDNDSIFDGVKRMNFLVIQTLKNMGVSGALLETCFIDNASDMKIWEANKSAIDHDIVMGIVEGWGLGDAADDVKPTPAPTPTPSVKSIDQLAQEVMDGKWGNNPARTQKLTAAGYDAIAVQARVNEILLGGASKPSPTPTPSTIKVGDWVGVKVGAKDYNGNNAGGVVRGKVWYTVDELKGDRAVLDIPGICTPFHLRDLFK